MLRVLREVLHGGVTIWHAGCCSALATRSVRDEWAAYSCSALVAVPDTGAALARRRGGAGASDGSVSTQHVLWGSLECVPARASARPAAFARALKLLVFGFTSSSSGWIWAHASPGTIILAGATLENRAGPHRQAPSRKFQSAAGCLDGVEE